MVNLLIILGIAALVIIYLGYKFNTLRTKLAFFFIFLGLLVISFFIFLVATGSNFNFAVIGDAASAARPYFSWIKGAVINIFETTGRAIGLID